MTTNTFSHRLATPDDIPAIDALMEASIIENNKGVLSEKDLIAARETMGVDRTLIDDQTYFVIETLVDGDTVMVACGGWGKRRTLYGGAHTEGRDDSFSDPATEPARIRAMFTHPDWIRKGIGTLLLNLGEGAARDAGYKLIELGSTVAGIPLYEARGYTAFFKEETKGSNGAIKTVVHMRKSLT
ncbi:MAG: GNAT family N-acetyltransferase [Pseudomonadota bacterium]